MWISDYMPFAVVSLLASGVCAAIALYAWKRRNGHGIKLFALLMAALAWAALWSAVEYLVSAEALRAKVFASQLYLLGSSPAALLAFLFAARYTQRDRWLSRPVTALLWLPIVLELLLIFTNARHALYWPQITTTAEGAAARVVFGHGTVTDVLAIYSYGLLLASAGLLVWNALRAPSIYRRQSALLVAATLAPVATNVVYYFDLGPWQDFDFTPLSFALSGVLLAVAIFRYQAVALTPVALDTLFEHLSDGVLVVNEGGLVVSANPAARSLLAQPEGRLLGQRVDRLPQPWGGVLDSLRHIQRRPLEVELQHARPPRTIEVSAAAFLDRNQRRVGSTLVLHDVTGYRALQRSLADANAELESRVSARTAELRAMRDSLAEHVGNLSSQLSVLYEVILLGGQAPDEAEVGEQTLETVMAALGAQAGFIALWNSQKGCGRVATMRNIPQEAQEGLGTLPAAWLFGESVPHTILDLQDDTVPAGLRLDGMAACVTTAVHRAGKPVAAIGIFWCEAPALSVESLALFRALVDQLAILAENARLRRLQNESLVQEERSRLARDLHDSVTQALYALALRAETTANAVRQGRTEQLDERLERIAASARQALREMRLLLYELRLSASERLPVAEALRLRLDAVEGRAGIAAQLEVDPALSLPLEHEPELYWIAMEALNNALKHAAANRVAVALRRCGEGYELAIEDDGVGLAADAAARGGQGLRSMQERAERLGGLLAVGPSTLGGAGVRLYVAGARWAGTGALPGAASAEEVAPMLEREASA